MSDHTHNTEKRLQRIGGGVDKPSELTVRQLCRAAAAELATLRASVEALEKERDHWKANHARELEVNRILRDRPDLGDRAKRVEALISERDELVPAVRRLVEAARDLGESWGPTDTIGSTRHGRQIVNVILALSDSTLAEFKETTDGR